MKNQFQLVLANLTALGTKRLSLLFIAAIMVIGFIGIGVNYINKPIYQTLYVGLERDDINRIGIVLADAGIKFDVDADGTSVLVETGKTSKARMILAEKGLPSSSGSGYELFDNLGSLGLTSFMQEVTRVRVLEGEIARSIQAISGIKAARVHIVKPDHRSFGSRKKDASASVLIRSSGSQTAKAAYAIRHLVSAAVPQLALENVTVLDANGEVLASGDDPTTSSLTNSIGVQNTIEGQLKEHIRKSLVPYLGESNFRVNVQASIDTDKRQIEETIFDPESRVERSVQVVKTQDSTSQRSHSEPTSVDQNLPNAEPTSVAEGPQSSQASERREETTNYELNTKKIATISNGYEIKKLSASIVVNKKRIEEVLGVQSTPEQFSERMEQIKQVAMAAAGFDVERGDILDVAAVEFMNEIEENSLPEPGLVDSLSAQLGTMINALAFLVGSVLLVFLGIRPMIRAVSRPAKENLVTSENSDDEALPAPPAQAQLTGLENEKALAFAGQADDGTADFLAHMKKSPQERLGYLASESEEASAQALRRWIDADAA